MLENLKSYYIKREIYSTLKLSTSLKKFDQWELTTYALYKDCGIHVISVWWENCVIAFGLLIRWYHFVNECPFILLNSAFCVEVALFLLFVTHYLPRLHSAFTANTKYFFSKLLIFPIIQRISLEYQLNDSHFTQKKKNLTSPFPSSQTYKLKRVERWI